METHVDDGLAGITDGFERDTAAWTAPTAHAQAAGVRMDTVPPALGPLFAWLP